MYTRVTIPTRRSFVRPNPVPQCYQNTNANCGTDRSAVSVYTTSTYRPANGTPIVATIASADNEAYYQTQLSYRPTYLATISV